MDPVHDDVFETAIGIECRCLSLYRAMASRVRDAAVRKLFISLAKEESVHLAAFCNLYQGSEDDLVHIIGRSVLSESSPLFVFNSQEGDPIESYALQIALREEQSCIDCYSVFVDTIWDNKVREVFVRFLNESWRHYELISKEYQSLMADSGRIEKNLTV